MLRLRAPGQHLEIVRVAHHGEDVAERIDHRRPDEPLAEVPGRFEHPGAQRHEAVDGCLGVVHVPVDGDAAGPTRLVGQLARGVLPIEDPQLVLVIADRNSMYGGRLKYSSMPAPRCTTASRRPGRRRGRRRCSCLSAGRGSWSSLDHLLIQPIRASCTSCQEVSEPTNAPSCSMRLRTRIARYQEVRLGMLPRGAGFGGSSAWSAVSPSGSQPPYACQYASADAWHSSRRAAASTPST